MKNQLITKRRLQQSIIRYGIVTMLIVVIGGYFGYRNYLEYRTSQTALEQQNLQLAQLKAVANKSKNDYLALKKDLDTQNSGVNQAIDKILPNREDFTNLAREIDGYFLDSKKSSDEVFLSDIRFNSPRLDGKNEFGVLPFSINISGSEKGFKNFLNYIEQSGDLNDKTRLLDISTLNLAYQNEQAIASTNADSTVNTNLPADTNKTINANINLNAYFQKPTENIPAQQ